MNDIQINQTLKAFLPDWTVFQSRPQNPEDTEQYHYVTFGFMNCSMLPEAQRRLSQATKDSVDNMLDGLLPNLSDLEWKTYQVRAIKDKDRDMLTIKLSKSNIEQLQFEQDAELFVDLYEQKVKRGKK